jgi:hypothetical protein
LRTEKLTFKSFFWDRVLPHSPDWLQTFDPPALASLCAGITDMHHHTRLRKAFFFSCGTGVWTQGLHFEPLHQPFFVMGFFEIGFKVWAGFEPWSSWSLPPE